MDELSVVSYNIWFDETDRNVRFDALLSLIKSNNPDIICLQEVVPEIYNLLKIQLSEYKYFFPKQIKYRYGCVIFSKYIIENEYDHYYPNSKMGRNLLAVNIKYNSSINITIATSHFESLFDETNSNNVKLEQYMYAQNILNKLYDDGYPVILCSDTNILSNEEKYFFTDSRWNDVFYDTSNDVSYETYTYDTKENKNLITRNIKEIRSRIDRIMYRGGMTIKSSYYKLLRGIDGIEPSDHFGLFTKFIVSNCEIEI